MPTKITQNIIMLKKYGTSDVVVSQLVTDFLGAYQKMGELANVYMMEKKKKGGSWIF